MSLPQLEKRSKRNEDLRWEMRGQEDGFSLGAQGSLLEEVTFKLKWGTELHKCQSPEAGVDVAMAVAQWADGEWQGSHFPIDPRPNSASASLARHFSVSFSTPPSHPCIYRAKSSLFFSDLSDQALPFHLCCHSPPSLSPRSWIPSPAHLCFLPH